MRSEASAAKGRTTYIIMTILKGMIWTCHSNFRDFFLSIHNYVLACVRACVCVWARRVQLHCCRCSASVLCMSSPTQSLSNECRHTLQARLLSSCSSIIMYTHNNTVFPRSVAAATINFSFTEVRHLFEGSVYSARRKSTISHHAPSAHVNFVLFLSHSHLRARWLTLSSSLPSSPFISDSWPSCLATHLRMRIATVHMNAATVRGRPLLCLARVLCGAYSRAAFIRGAAFIQGNTVYRVYNVVV